MPLRKWTDNQLKKAILNSKNFAEVMSKLDLCDGTNRSRIKIYAEKMNIDFSHFEDVVKKRNQLIGSYSISQKIPMEKILIDNSNYNNTSFLKHRLYREGLKKKRCEICGQGEEWLGKKMSLILDHINGRRKDNRIENLRIVCPNCEATLPTHAGKNVKDRKIKTCLICGKEFYCSKRKYCSSVCTMKAWSKPRHDKRKVERPFLDVLTREINSSNRVAVAKKYGISEATIRKWINRYLHLQGTEQK